MTSNLATAALWLLLLEAVASGQAPVEQPAAAPPPAAPAQAPVEQPAPPAEVYSYEPDGRRDPFLNLLVGTATGAVPSHAVDGVGGLKTLELSVRGVLTSRGAYLAMVQGPDNRTYIVRSGDQLLDGQVKSVTAEGLVILQDVTDPLSLVKQREVYRRLRALEDAKE